MRLCDEAWDVFDERCLERMASKKIPSYCQNAYELVPEIEYTIHVCG
jgi:hypothetical protein